MTQVEFADPADGGRPLDFMLIYPAAPDRGAIPFKMFLATNLHLFKDAPIVADQLKHPLVMFSHGAGGNGSVNALVRRIPLAGRIWLRSNSRNYAACSLPWSTIDPSPSISSSRTVNARAGCYAAVEAI